MYNEKSAEVKNKLEAMEQQILDLKTSYNYAGLKEGFTPFQMQTQTQMIDRFNLAKNLHNDWIGKFKNYGEFVGVLQEFDTFDKKAAELREKACMVLEIAGATQKYNDYLRSHKEYAPKSNYMPVNKELSMLAKDYLMKAPQIADFIRANYRQTIIKEALLDLSAEDIKKALSKHLIKPSEIQTMDLTVTQGNVENYRTNLKICQQMFQLHGNQATDRFTTTLVGVSFSNDDGTNRQTLLAELAAVSKNRQVTLSLLPSVYRDQPAFAVQYNNQTIGFLSQDLANKLSSAYDGHKITPELIRVTGGNGYTYGCEIAVCVDMQRTNQKPQTAQQQKEITHESEQVHKEQPQ